MLRVSCLRFLTCLLCDAGNGGVDEGAMFAYGVDWPVLCSRERFVELLAEDDTVATAPAVVDSEAEAARTLKCERRQLQAERNGTKFTAYVTSKCSGRVLGTPYNCINTTQHSMQVTHGASTRPHQLDDYQYGCVFRPGSRRSVWLTGFGFRMPARHKVGMGSGWLAVKVPRLTLFLLFFCFWLSVLWFGQPIFVACPCVPLGLVRIPLPCVCTDPRRAHLIEMEGRQRLVQALSRGVHRAPVLR